MDADAELAAGLQRFSQVPTPFHGCQITGVPMSGV